MWWSDFYQGKEALRSLNKAGRILDHCTSSYLPWLEGSGADLSQLRIWPWVQALKKKHKKKRKTIRTRVSSSAENQK